MVWDVIIIYLFNNIFDNIILLLNKKWKIKENFIVLEKYNFIYIRLRVYWLN